VVYQALASIDFMIFLSISLFSFHILCWVEVHVLQRWPQLLRSRYYDPRGYSNYGFPPYKYKPVLWLFLLGGKKSGALLE